MQCSWHAQDLLHNDSPLLQCTALASAKGDEVEGGAEWGHHGLAVEVLAGKGTQWYLAAEKAHSNIAPVSQGREGRCPVAEPTAVVKSLSLDELCSL